MKLLLERAAPQAGYTDGQLWVDNAWFCYTIEDEDRALEAGGEKVYGKTCIPRGIYEVQLTESVRFKKMLPLLLNVPGFSGVRIHSGNTAADTDGCVLLGTVRAAPGEVRNSRLACGRLMILLERAIAQGDKIFMEIK